MLISVVSANICANPERAQSHVAERIEQAHAAAQVVFGQEIIPSRYKQAWGAEAKRVHRGVYGIAGEVPITVPWAHRVIRARTVKVHGGLSHVSPTRIYTSVETMHAPNALLVAFVNLHPVSKGYTAARHRTTQWQWRNDHLLAYWRAVQAECRRLVAAGYTVVVGGDCNWPDPPRPHPSAAVLAGSGLDHLWVIAGKGARVQTRPQRVIGPAPSLGMDHPLIVGSFDLTPAGAKPPAPTTPTPVPAPKPTPPKEPTVAHSYNGWSASPTLRLRPFVVNGVSFPPGIRDDDDVETVLRYVVEQFSTRVEPLHSPGCWGFSYRRNRNANNLSNHSSGTAVDVNAPRHPNGVRTSRTFTAAQITEVHKILDEVDDVVAWGGDYRGTPDSMHFEINGTASHVARVAATIRTNPEEISVADISKIMAEFAKLNAKVDDLADEVQKVKAGTGRLENDAATEGELTGSAYYERGAGQK